MMMDTVRTAEEQLGPSFLLVISNFLCFFFCVMTFLHNSSIAIVSAAAAAAVTINMNIRQSLY